LLLGEFTYSVYSTRFDKKLVEMFINYDNSLDRVYCQIFASPSKLLDGCSQQIMTLMATCGHGLMATCGLHVWPHVTHIFETADLDSHHFKQKPLVTNLLNTPSRVT